jgi:hypothetical protein
MPFTTPAFQEAGESQIVDNIIELLDRDMKLALDYFYPADNLPDFAVKSLGALSVFNYPLCVVGPQRMSSEVQDTWVEQNLIVLAGVEVKDTTKVLATRKLMKYVRAFKAVIRSALDADLMPPNAQLIHEVADISHQYTSYGTAGTEFTQGVQFEIRLRFGEI